MASIWLYIGQDSPKQADRFVDLLLEKIIPLVSLPQMGIARDDLQEGLRMLVFRDYLIFYVDTPDRLVVVRVLHGSRDVSAVFGGDLAKAEPLA